MTTARTRASDERTRRPPARGMAPASIDALGQVPGNGLADPAVLALQRTIGSRATGKLIASGASRPTPRFARKGILDPRAVVASASGRHRSQADDQQ